MRYFIVIFFFVTCTLSAKSTDSRPTVQSGRVIFITGSCSSGKSSLAQSVAQKLNAKYFAFDECVMPRVLNKMIARYVGSFFAMLVTKLFMRNFFSLIGFLSDKRKYAFQKKFYKELEKGIAFQPTVMMYKKVRAQALQGHTVIVEAPLLLGDSIDCLSSLSTLRGLDVTLVLAYCPFEQLVDRIKQRNQSGNKKNYRELDWAITNFVHSFKLSTDYPDQAIDNVLGSSVKTFVSTHAQPIYRKQRLNLLKETQEIVLKHVSSDDVYYITPKLSYDLIVNTLMSTPDQGAESVVAFMRDHQTNDAIWKNLPA